MHTPPRNPAAFTLVEVMMASAILVVGFSGLIQALTIGSEALDTARKQQVAIQIMDAEIERLRAGSWSVIAGLPATATLAIDQAGNRFGDTTGFALTNYTADATDDNAALATSGAGFTCSYVRSRLRPSSATAANVTYVRVDYTVTWTSNTGRIFRRTQPAFFGRNGLHLSYQKT
jgi:prepilin-type N-terminal cleavage/methylation domain-containing protein